ncbi:MAG: hypothetical protein KGJ86_19000 [Chloroflexota bacterium]|nr:hypothetical protein [Chloroflexota bacterium]
MLAELSPETKQCALSVYRELKELLQSAELPPGARANIEQALSSVWQALNNLALEYEFLYGLGV